MKQLQKSGVLLAFSVGWGYFYKDKNYSFSVAFFKIFLALWMEIQVLNRSIFIEIFVKIEPLLRCFFY